MSDERTSSVKTYPDAPERWFCDECKAVSTSRLSAPNPFAPSETVVGCPNCRAVESLTRACQMPGCSKRATGGYLGLHGYRYFWACGTHSMANPYPARRRTT